MELVAPDRPVASNLVFEIYLLLPVIRAENDEIARNVKGIEPPELLREDFRLVESLEEGSGVPIGRQAQRELAVRRGQDSALRVLQHHKADSIQLREARDQAWKSQLDRSGIEPPREVGKVDVCQATRVGHLDPTAR